MVLLGNIIKVYHISFDTWHGKISEKKRKGPIINQDHEVIIIKILKYALNRSRGLLIPSPGTPKAKKVRMYWLLGREQ